MELPCLTSGNLQCGVCELLADVVHGNPLLGSAESTWHTNANHEAEGILDAKLLTLLAHVSVILLVASVGLDQLGVLEGNLSGADIVQGLLQAASELPGLNLDHLIRLDRAIVALSTTSCSLHAKLGVELALELAEAGVVLINVLIITEADGHEPLGTKLLKHSIQVAAWLCEVDLGILGALAPVVRISKGKNCVLHAAQLSLQLCGSIIELAPEVATIARELTLACCGNAEDNEGLTWECMDIEGVHCANSHRCRGIATAAALAANSLGALLSVAGVGGVQDCHSLR
mmetsp:Transcript_58881/g.140485  ORF Transcript_58881/g.140485 Transcript_58881/m.140485 type:complete len:288 (-) Transcript_58881:727-1590(-)